MRIISPYARLLPPPGYVEESPFMLEHGLEMLRRVEWIARKSHKTEDRQTAESYHRFLQTWVHEHGDYSVIEHCVISSDLLVDRGLSHELVRHRIAAYTQESTRFVNYGKRANSIDVILPPELVPVHQILNYQGEWLLQQHPRVAMMDAAARLGTAEDGKLYEVPDRLAAWYVDWLLGALDAERHYLYQVMELKVPPELARDMLPHCTATNMVATHDLRGWRHVMLMRTSIETHRKLRPLMGLLLDELKTKVPILYQDIEYGDRQVENLRKGR